MCRYAWHNYRDHFACFHCRKSFKYWQWEEVDESYFNRRQELKHVPREIICPECSRQMVDMGLDFKAPPKDKGEAWEILRLLESNGFTFHSCGCSVGFTPPEKLRDVPHWLEEHRQHSDGERLLRRFENRVPN